jgi:hypothetical protein
LAAAAGKTQITILNVNNGETLLSSQPQGFEEDATITVLKLGKSNKDGGIGLGDGSNNSIVLQNNKQLIPFHLDM